MNLRAGFGDATEGSDFSVFVSVEPTNLMTSFDVIIETYVCGDLLAATRKTTNVKFNLVELNFYSWIRLHSCEQSGHTWPR